MIMLLLLVACFMFPLRTAGYNPLQANGENRILDILAETSRVDVVRLAGTCEPHKGGITTSCIEGRTIISSGFTCTSMSFKSCGISITVGKAHRKVRFLPVEISGKAKGRGLSQRVQSGRIDINCISAYFSPLPRKMAELGVRSPGVSCNQTKGSQQEDLCIRRGTIWQDCVPICSDEDGLQSGSAGGRRSDQLRQTDEMGGDGRHCAKILEGKETSRAESLSIQAVTGGKRSSMSFTAGSMPEEIGSDHFGPTATVVANSDSTVCELEEGAVTVQFEIDEECESPEERGTDPLTIRRVPALGAGVAGRGAQSLGLSGLGRSSSSILNSLPLPSKADLDAFSRVPVLGAGVAGVSSFPTYVSSAEIEATEAPDLAAFCRVPVLGDGVEDAVITLFDSDDECKSPLDSELFSIDNCYDFVAQTIDNSDDDTPVAPVMQSAIETHFSKEPSIIGNSIMTKTPLISSPGPSDPILPSSLIPGLSSVLLSAPPPPGLENNMSTLDKNILDNHCDAFDSAAADPSAELDEWLDDESTIDDMHPDHHNLNSNPGPSSPCLSPLHPGLSSAPLAAPPPPGLEHDKITNDKKVDHHTFEHSNKGPGLIQQKGNTLEWRSPHDFYDRAKPSSSGCCGSNCGIGSRSLDVEMALFDQLRLRKFNQNLLESKYVKAHAFSQSDILTARHKIAGSSSDIVSLLCGKPNHILVKNQQLEQHQQLSIIMITSRPSGLCGRRCSHVIASLPTSCPVLP